MAKRILKELDELKEAGIITEETASRIEIYFKKEDEESGTNLLIIFGIIGALLIGLGIILIVANKWEELSKSWKLTAAFTPMLIGQIICAYTLLKQKESRAWREGSTVFLVLAVGATISLVSQIFYMPSDLGPYMLIWSLLSLPLIYIMRSSVASLLYLIGITIYACNQGYEYASAVIDPIYWLLFVLIIPFYIWLLKNRNKDNFTMIHHWFMPLSLIICLGTIGNEQEEWLFVAYMSLMSLLFLIGSHFIGLKSIFSNGFKSLSIIGMIVILLILSFVDVWRELLEKEYFFGKIVSSPEFIVGMLLSVAALLLLLFRNKWKDLAAIDMPAILFILFIPLFILGYVNITIPVVLCNLILLAYGILTIKEGVESNHFGVLNFGLLILAALILMRFFDDKITFVMRGVLFLVLGFAFFAANYWLMQKRKKKINSQA